MSSICLYSICLKCEYDCGCVVSIVYIYIYIYMFMLMFVYDVIFEMISLSEIVLYITCSVCTVNLLRGSIESYWIGTQ